MCTPTSSCIKNLLLPLTLLLVFAGCNNKDAPDITDITVNTTIGRFDKFMFEKIDTISMAKSLNELQSAYPYFTNDFISHILGLTPISSLTTDSVTLATLSELKRFIKVTRPLYDSLSPKFTDISGTEDKLNRSFRYLKFYYPDYKIPKIVTYIGPFNAPGIAITNEALAIGLQLYGGKDLSFYTSAEGQEIFPLYISRTFDAIYIPSNCMKSIIEDLYPDKNRGKPLIEQMIEKGKQWWLLEKLLPGEADSIKTGYTQAQLLWCKENEGTIWNFFLQHDYLYNEELDLIKTYIGEAPFTEGMPDASPGNIGQWVGWKIVEKYAAKNRGLGADALMKTDYKKILSGAKYKPR